MHMPFCYEAAQFSSGEELGAGQKVDVFESALHEKQFAFPTSVFFDRRGTE